MGWHPSKGPWCCAMLGLLEGIEGSGRAIEKINVRKVSASTYMNYASSTFNRRSFPKALHRIWKPGYRREW